MTARLIAGSPEAERIDGELSSWRQGDVARAEQSFFLAADPGLPLSDEAAASAGGAPAVLDVEVEGLVVVSQTCDVVRPCVARPFVEVSPLVRVEARVVEEVRRERRPRYAYVPAVASDGLVADLDRTMTVEKSLVAGWARTPGCSGDAERRAFARALARKRERFAFPDDFVEAVRKLQKRIVDKHDGESEEGRLLGVLREIRVRATPSWDSEQVELFFFFVCEPGESRPEKDQTKSWLALVPPRGRFAQAEGILVELADMTAVDYVESDPLDLEHLSTG